MGMTETRFLELLAIYGADLSRWPQTDRMAMEGFLETAPHRLRDLWESERSFDTLLSFERDAPAPVALEKRLIAAAPARRPAQASRTLFGRWTGPQWATGGAIAASLALGFAVGYAGEPQAAFDEFAIEAPEMLALSENGSAVVLLSEQAGLN